MTSTTNGTLLARVRGRRSIEASRVAKRSLSLGRTTLGALAFRALARALAWVVLLARAGSSAGRGMGLVWGPDVDVRPSRPGAVRREAAESGVGRLRVRADGPHPQ